MSGAHLSFIWYSYLYFVRGLLITVRRLIVTDTNVCVALSRQVCHSMTSLSSLKTANRFTFFSLFQQKFPIQTHPIRNLTTFKHLPTHMCPPLVTLWLNPPASATSLIHNWPLQVILTYEQICWVLSTIIMIPPYPSNIHKLQYLLQPISIPPWCILLIGL